MVGDRFLAIGCKEVVISQSPHHQDTNAIVPKHGLLLSLVVRVEEFFVNRRRIGAVMDVGKVDVAPGIARVTINF